MISWIQNRLIRHGRWIFLTLLAVIIVAFVFTIGNTPGFAPSPDRFEEDFYYGVNLSSDREMRPMQERVQYSILLNTGRPPMSNQQVSEGLITRIAMLHLANELSIPAPTERQMSEYVRTKPAFFGSDGAFSRDAYIAFVDDLEANPSISPNLLFRVLEEDFRIDRVVRALTGPGFVMPGEALAEARHDQTEVTLTVASTRYRDFNPEIEVTDALIESFYENNAERYREPDRIKARLARFSVDPASIEVSEEALNAHFEANRNEFEAIYQSSLEEGEEPGELTLAEVRPLVEDALQTERARRASNEKAHAFAFRLYDQNIRRDSSTFEELLSAENIELRTVEPYSVEEIQDRALPSRLLETGFTLTPNRYFSDAVRLNGDFGVLIFDERVESFIPPLADVRTAVEENFRAQERRRLFTEEGRLRREQLQAALSEGTSFEEAAAALELTVEGFEPFAFGEPLTALNDAVIQASQTLNEGEVSPMVSTGNAGFWVFVNQRNVPDIDPTSAAVAESLEFLKRYSAFATSRSFLSELIESGEQAR